MRPRYSPRCDFDVDDEIELAVHRAFSVGGQHRFTSIDEDDEEDDQEIELAPD